MQYKVLCIGCVRYVYKEVIHITYEKNLRILKEMEQKIICNKCGKEIEISEAKERHLFFYCPDCFNADCFECSDCGGVMGRGDEHKVLANGELICMDCYDIHYFECYNCNDIYSNSDKHRFSSRNYCEDCFYEDYGYCEDCGMAFGRDDLHNGYCCNCRGSDERDNSYLFWDRTNQNADKKLKGIANTFGAEIETMGEEGLTNKQKLKGWSSDYDGSLSNNGVEFRTPILKGYKGFLEIKRMCRILKNSEYYINSECGLHIHLGITETERNDIKFINKIITAYKKIEPIIFSMLPKSRENNNYCKRIDGAFLTKSMAHRKINGLKEDYYKVKMFKNYEQSHHFDKRYYGLNIHSIWFRGTLELRYHSGTINPTKIINWIKINQAILNFLRKTDIRTIKNLDNKSFFFFKVLRKQELIEYVDNRIKLFGGINPKQTQEGD